MESDAIFEKWNLLPEEMKLECIQWLDFKSRYHLRNTCHTERRLVNSQTFPIHSIELDRDEMEGDTKLIVFLDREETNGYRWVFRAETLEATFVPLLSFILQTSIIDDFSIFHHAGCPIKCLESLESTTPYQINTLRGYVPLCLIEKCARNAVKKFGISRMEFKKRLVPRLLTFPALESTKDWDLHLDRCPDLGVGFARKFMDIDVNIRSSLNFGTVSNETIDDFVERMGDLRIVDRTDALVRFETNNPEKHVIMMKFDKRQYSHEHRFVMVVVSADIEASQYDNYLFG